MATVPLAGRVAARTVLLADDDEDFRVAPAEALDAKGYNGGSGPARGGREGTRAPT